MCQIEEEIMRFESLLAATLVLSQMSGTAHAQRRDDTASPRFSAVEMRTVGRNELLRAVVAHDPWLVRHILDLVAHRNSGGADEFSAQLLDGIDRSRNPDIVSGVRTAAGSVELIEFLRRALAEKNAIQNKSKYQMTGRSAPGSVEFIQMLRDAKSAARAAPK
jgi:hypothetical protein